MSESNKFEVASRKKFRYGESNITTEDLWDIPLESTSSRKLSLDSIAKGLKKQLQEYEEESFVRPRNASNTLLQMKFDIVRHIITVRLEEMKKAEDRAKDKERQELIKTIIAEKQTEGLRNMSVEDLKKELG